MTPLRQTRVLIVKLSSLSGLFHALPTVHALKTGMNAFIDWAVQPEYVDLVRCFTDVSAVLSFPRYNLIQDGPNFLRELCETRYDYVVDLQGLMKSAVITALARGKKKIGPSGTREGSQFFYHQLAGKKDRQRHAVDELMDIVRHLHLTVPETAEFPVVFPKHSDLGKGRQIALCPGSPFAGKNWPPERFVQTAKQLKQDADTTFHLVGEPADHWLCEKIADEIGAGTLNHAGKTTLVELGSLLQEMNLLITVESGPMHIAAAAGTPTLALFGPTSPLRTGPYGKPHRVIESPFRPLEKIISKKTRLNDLRYIEAIPVEPVVQQAREIIRQTGTQ
ncbi:MAG: glycosyltransferase family 9 protein [Pontiellaceae bacterium]|nr:glycosyltransferase family 9 protein [Pontiellaceae bacterium]